MAWYLNKETGQKWDVEDKQLIKRLMKDDAYELIEEEPKKKAKSTTKKV